MTNSRRGFSRRVALLVSLALMSIPLGILAVTAYACGGVPYLQLSISATSGSAVPGTTIDVGGAAFDPTGGPVQLRLGTLDGPALAQATPDATGSFDAPLTIPADATPGATYITATQNDSLGNPVYGTPDRMAFTVLAPPAPPAPPASATTTTTTPAVTTPAPSPPVTTLVPVVMAVSPSCIVPRVNGLSRGAAERAIRAAHCAVGKVTEPKQPRSKNHHYKLVAAGTNLRRGTNSADGTKVALRLRWV